MDNGMGVENEMGMGMRISMPRERVVGGSGCLLIL